MRIILFPLLFLCGVFADANSQSTVSDTFMVFYLGGQSNMNGYGFNSDLPDLLSASFDDVWIFQGNPVGDNDTNGGLGAWSKLAPGHGAGFSSDGQENNLSNRFGLELTFAQTMKKKYPNRKIALIKYARGGSSLDSLAAGNFGSWEPDYASKGGINQYDNYLKTIKIALAHDDINRDGTMDHLIPAGIIWMQGESDAAYSLEIAMAYENNLKRLMDLLRASLLADDLPIVIGKISDSGKNPAGKVWRHGEIVQYAQENFVLNDQNAEIIRSTKMYSYSDPWHYDSAGYIDFGKQCALAMQSLLKW